MNIPALDDLRATFSNGMTEAQRFLYEQFNALRHDVRDITEAVNRLDNFAEVRSIDIPGVNLDANGRAELRGSGMRPRPGFYWRIERITVVVVEGTNPITATLYSGDVKPVNVRYVTPNGAFASDNLGAHGVFCDERKQPVIVFNGGATNAGKQAQASFQVTEVRKDG